VLGKLHPMVWYELVDVAILVSLGLRMADQYDHLREVSQSSSRHYKVDLRGVSPY
jgi:hypothetical protein